ncbi:MAG: YhcH/YjgK/YiaL family protein [Lactobacillus helsingborgensis]|nr:YhcH/YjgK/YiaL family protein [Lactobacillus helsingborgensis]MCT6827449.1 YhcH/YjgK/YiaL family protein [Lactobacillus helsingborgensis]MCT6847297.1 YhcH/YjgK/YiaL family protein [Lactobacillus helsingborgensis]
MIYANINDSTTTFIRQNQYLDKAFKWLQETDLTNLAVGRYDISDGIFVKIQEYNTKDEKKGRFENHQTHLDFHYLIKGAEITRVTKPDGLTEIDNALASPDDVAHYQRFTGPATSICLHPGDYIILFPEDAHEACLDLDVNEKPCKKAVIKVPIKLVQ